MTDTTRIINKWVNDLTEPLFIWAKFKLSDEELAKDMVQDTFLAAYQNISSFENKSEPKTWLFSILNHKIIDHYRKKLRNPVSMRNEDHFFDNDGMWKDETRPTHWEDDKSLLDDVSFVSVLERCKDKLPEQWLSALQLKYLLQKDGNDICKELELSPTNYWQIIRRAKLQLRECLDINWFKQ